MSSSALALEYRDLNSLVPFSKNARVHPKSQIEQIKASIVATTFANPILIDDKDCIIAGHGRLIAARELGMSQVPVIVVSGLSERQARALRIADNKIALNAGWDPDLLKQELGEISVNSDIDVQVTGFSIGEINALSQPGKDPDDDSLPQTRSAPRTRLGDIWELGDHRVGCGDARDLDFLAHVVGQEPVDCAFLDPPWNVPIKGHANVKSRHREFAMASGEMSKAAFQDFLAAAVTTAERVSRDGAVHFLCIDWRHYDALSAACRSVYDEQLNLCVWNKSNAGMGALYRSKYELIGVYRCGKAPHLNTVQLGRHGRSRTNVWDFPSVNSFGGSRRHDLALHPTVKPVAMVADAIQDVTRQGDSVLDTFLGAGTTLIACERSGRIFRGGDIDPAYVDLAVDRWVALTNREPVLRRAETTCG